MTQTNSSENEGNQSIQIRKWTMHAHVDVCMKFSKKENEKSIQDSYIAGRCSLIIQKLIFYLFTRMKELQTPSWLFLKIKNYSNG